MAEIDAILLPTVPDAAPKLGELAPISATSGRPISPVQPRPGSRRLSVCNGFDSAGLPLSLQIVGRRFDEATVLRIGHAYERAARGASAGRSLAGTRW